MTARFEPDRVRGDDHAFDERVRVGHHQRQVLAGARLALVGVDDQILGHGRRTGRGVGVEPRHVVAPGRVPETGRPGRRRRVPARPLPQLGPAEHHQLDELVPQRRVVRGLPACGPCRSGRACPGPAGQAAERGHERDAGPALRGLLRRVEQVAQPGRSAAAGPATRRTAPGPSSVVSADCMSWNVSQSRTPPASTPHIGSAPAMRSGCCSTSSAVTSPPSDDPQASTSRGRTGSVSRTAIWSSRASSTAHPVPA